MSNENKLVKYGKPDEAWKHKKYNLIALWGFCSLFFLRQGLVKFRWYYVDKSTSKRRSTRVSLKYKRPTQ